MSEQCACRMDITYDEPLPSSRARATFTPCPLHAAAPKLLAHLEAAEQEIDDLIGQFLSDEHMGGWRKRMAESARLVRIGACEAIKEARGELSVRSDAPRGFTLRHCLIDAPDTDLTTP